MRLKMTQCSTDSLEEEGSEGSNTKEARGGKAELGGSASSGSGSVRADRGALSTAAGAREASVVLGI